MPGENPYAAPQGATSSPASPRAGMLIGSVGAVFLTSILGGLLGLLVGAALGAFAPDYYRSVFAGGSQPGFDPMAVGIRAGASKFGVCQHFE